jgi:hypothetical protein
MARGDVTGGVGVKTRETWQNRVSLWRNGPIYLSEPATDPLSFAYPRSAWTNAEQSLACSTSRPPAIRCRGCSR